MYIADFTHFGFRELSIASKLLKELAEGRYPDDFCTDGIKIGFNLYSGDVFLLNEDGQIAMLTGGVLKSFYCSETGKEGFYDELLEQFEKMNSEDQEWFLGL